MPLFILALALLLPLIALPQPTAFSYVGGPQPYTVPAGVSRLAVVAIGATGGRVSPLQQRSCGAVVTATFNVVPGEVLTVLVGGAGADASGRPAYNGGGAGGMGAAGGGGATELRRAIPTGDYLATRNALLVAGGAGGTDWLSSPTPQGGAGGAPVGSPGIGVNGNAPGQGATQLAPGGGPLPGWQAQGGSGGYGGGGGGYYGGGAATDNGSAGGGGGGSSWVASAATDVSYAASPASTPARLTLTPVAALGISAYPNPFSGVLRVQTATPVACALYDTLGQLVLEHTLPAGGGEVPGVAQLPAGMYSLRLNQASGQQVLKLLHCY